MCSSDITQSGTTDNVRAIECEPQEIFESEAIAAAEQFAYQPAMNNGQPVRTTGIKNKITFVIEKTLNVEAAANTPEIGPGARLIVFPFLHELPEFSPGESPVTTKIITRLSEHGFDAVQLSGKSVLQHVGYRTF